MNISDCHKSLQRNTGSIWKSRNMVEQSQFNYKITEQTNNILLK